MFDGYDESSLLELIEGVADARTEQKLRRQLANDPAARAQIERMMRDREQLRSLPEPAMPADFASKLESMMARLLLIEPVPVMLRDASELRRQQRRRRRRIRWPRLAAVAVMMLAVLAGAWAAVNGVLVALRQPGGQPIAANEITLPTESSAPSGVAGDNSATSAHDQQDQQMMVVKGTIHHYGPALMQSLPGANHGGSNVNEDQPALAGRAGRDDALRSDSMQHAQAFAADKLVMADVAIVIEAPDVSRAEEHLRNVVAGLGKRGALVRNFSYAEARRLEQEARPGRGQFPQESRPLRSPSSSPIRPAPRASDNREFERLADSVRRQQRAKVDGSGGPGASGQSAHLVGSVELAASLECQLEFSSRGATHTVSVASKDLPAIINQLSFGDGHSAILCMLPPAPHDPAASIPALARNAPVTLWASEGEAVRKIIQSLAQSSDGTEILLPVAIRAAAD